MSSKTLGLIFVTRHVYECFVTVFLFLHDSLAGFNLLKIDGELPSVGSNHFTFWIPGIPFPVL